MSYGSNNHHGPILEDPPAGVSLTAGLISCIVMVWFLLVTTAIYYLEVGYERESKVVKIYYGERAKVRASQEGLIQSSAHWYDAKDPDTDDNHRRLIIPIEEAMDIFVNRSAKGYD